MSDAVPAAARAHTEDLGAFVSASPSSYHAAQDVARRAEEAGYARLDETAAWDVVPGGRYVVVRDGSAIAFALPPTAVATTPFTILGTHTDSTGFKLKPRPTTGRDGWVQAGVEVYGGPLLNSWLDREVELAGRLATSDGAGGTVEHLVRTGPIARIPQLAIHLDRSANEGLALDKQRHTQPVVGLGDVSQADVLAELAAAAGDGVDAADVLGYDVVLAETQPPRAFGIGAALWASPRLDNLLSTHAAIAALLAVAPEDLTGIGVVAAFDHEEIGSGSRSGAAGPFLEDVLRRVSAALGASEDERARAFAASLCVSSDVGHAVHPNYPERHDPVNHPHAGGGPILKINANQRYATDAHGAARWQAACAAAGVPSQEFVSNNTVPCGSTTGPITATRLGIRVVDVGAAILSMHSARELTAVVDPWYLSRAMQAVLAG